MNDSTNLNQLLFESLVKHYENKGINVQAILHNSLFSQLPLEEKISLLKNNAETLVKTPSFLNSFNSLKPKEIIIGSGLTAGIASLIGRGYKPSHWQTPVFAGVSGAAISLIPILIAANNNYKKDVAARSNIINNRFMDAIIAKSNMAISKPSGLKALELIHGDMIKRINDVDAGTVPSSV